jgi:hypothetical protein
MQVTAEHFRYECQAAWLLCWLHPRPALSASRTELLAGVDPCVLASTLAPLIIWPCWTEFGKKALLSYFGFVFGLSGSTAYAIMTFLLLIL